MRTLALLIFLAGHLAAAGNPAAEAAFERATEQAKYRKWEAAADSYQAAISYDPNMALAYRGLGYCDYHLGKKDFSIRAYERYLQLVPGDKAIADYVAKMRATLPNPAAVATPKANVGVAPGDVLQWHDFKGAAEASKTSGKPLLYVCNGDWAPHSRRLTRQVFAKPEAARWLNENFVTVNISVPKSIKARSKLPYAEGKLLDRYVVKSVPTLIVEYPDGQSAQLIHGSKNGEETLEKLKALAAKGKPKG